MPRDLFACKRVDLAFGLLEPPSIRHRGLHLTKHLHHVVLHFFGLEPLVGKLVEVFASLELDLLLVSLQLLVLSFVKLGLLALLKLKVV